MNAGARRFTPLDFAQLLSIALIWAVNNICAKIATDAFPPMLTVALRFGIVLVALGAFIRVPPRERWPIFLLMLLCVGPVHFGAQYLGFALATNIAPMVVALQLWAPASVLFAALLLKERVNGLRWAGVVIAFLGAAAMNFDPAVFAELNAFAVMLLAAAGYGVGTVLVRKMGGGVDAWSMQGWVALMTTPIMLLGTATFETGQITALQDAGWLPWACVIFGALFSSIIGNVFMFRLLQRYEVSRTTPYLLLTPVISMGLAHVLLDNPLTPQILIGAAIAIGGVALIAVAERRFKAVA